TGGSVVGVQTVSDEETDRYGIVDPCEKIGRRYQVKNFVEKPELGTAPSNLAIMGRYVLTPEIFKHLGKHEIGAGGEIQLTDAIQALNESENVYAYDFDGKRYDVGEKFGFVKTTIDLALQNDEIKDELMEYLIQVTEEAKEKNYHKILCGKGALFMSERILLSSPHMSDEGYEQKYVQEAFDT